MSPWDLCMMPTVFFFAIVVKESQSLILQGWMNLITPQVLLPAVYCAQKHNITISIQTLVVDVTSNIIAHINKYIAPNAQQLPLHPPQCVSNSRHRLFKARMLVIR